MAKLAQMHVREPTLTAGDLSGVASRTLVMLGDDDEITFEHAVALYRGLPDAELAVIPGTSHGLLVEKPALGNAIILDFLTKRPRAHTGADPSRLSVAPRGRAPRGMVSAPLKCYFCARIAALRRSGSAGRADTQRLGRRTVGTIVRWTGRP